MKYFIPMILSFGLISCMHPIIQDHSETEGTVLQKEVKSGDVLATATFPPMENGKESVFTLQLSEAHASRPLTGAKVVVQVEYTQADGQNHSGDSSHTLRLDRQHGILWTGEMRETGQPGLYALSYVAGQLGEHMIAMNVIEIDNQSLDSPIVISAERFVNTQSDRHSGGMMGMSGSTTAVIVGATLMGAMMLAVVLTGSRMF